MAKNTGVREENNSKKRGRAGTAGESIRAYCTVIIVLTNLFSFFLGGLLTHFLIVESEYVEVSKHADDEEIFPEIGVGSLPVFQGEGGDAVYASKNGTRYYPADCGAGINRIKPENLIWYANAELASLDGLSMAVSCAD